MRDASLLLMTHEHPPGSDKCQGTVLRHSLQQRETSINWVIIIKYYSKEYVLILQPRILQAYNIFALVQS